MASRRLVTALTNATRRAFSEVRDAHPGEHFYVYALFSETGDDLQPTCHSEEALERVVATHAARAAKKRRKSSGPSAEALRWSAEEFAYHQHGEEHFAAVRGLPSDRPEAVSTSPWRRSARSIARASSGAERLAIESP
jgi:hypothetical protein